MSRRTVIRLRLRDKENCETSQLLWCGSTSYWERERPRPHSAEGAQEIDVSYSRTTCSRFALNAGEGARVPGNRSPFNQSLHFAGCRSQRCSVSSASRSSESRPTSLAAILE